jgi:hypothetical protein
MTESQHGWIRGRAIAGVTIASAGLLYLAVTPAWAQNPPAAALKRLRGARG